MVYQLGPEANSIPTLDQVMNFVSKYQGSRQD